MAVKCGHVYYLYFALARKDKLLVPAYIQPDDRVRFFVINTERTEFQKNNPEIAAHVIALPKEGNENFLTHNSWLTCHEVIGGYNAADFGTNNDCYRGPLDNVTLVRVRELIQESRLYSEVHKSMILRQWP